MQRGGRRKRRTVRGRRDLRAHVCVVVLQAPAVRHLGVRLLPAESPGDDRGQARPINGSGPSIRRAIRL